MGIRDKPIAPGSPWQNGFAERLIGSIRRECVDHIVVLGEEHLRRILTKLAQWISAQPTGTGAFLFEAFIPRKFKSNSFAHRGARVIDTDTLLRISLVLRVSSDGQEHEQDSEDNPNVNAHRGITVELNAARTLALSRELCRVLSGRGVEIRPWPSRRVPPRAP